MTETATGTCHPKEHGQRQPHHSRVGSTFRLTFAGIPPSKSCLRDVVCMVVQLKDRTDDLERDDLADELDSREIFGVCA